MAAGRLRGQRPNRDPKSHGAQKTNEDDPPSKRSHWALEALEAMRRGEASRLEEAFCRKDANINLTTLNGGYGGFRYVTWGTQFGGNVNGESILHLALRPENAKMLPNRFQIVTTLTTLGIDTTLRNDKNQTARDLHPLLYDAAYPIKLWNNNAVLAWTNSAARSCSIRGINSWLYVFQLYKVNGAKLTTIWNSEEFEEWTERRVVDLTRHGLTATTIKADVQRWHVAFKLLRHDMTNALRARKAHFSIIRKTDPLRVLRSRSNDTKKKRYSSDDEDEDNDLGLNGDENDADIPGNKPGENLSHQQHSTPVPLSSNHDKVTLPPLNAVKSGIVSSSSPLCGTDE